MKSNLGARPVPSINFSSIAVVAEPVGNNAQGPIIVQQVTKKENTITTSLILMAGILFWAHGSVSHDAWFKGEEVTGQVITGFFIGVIGLICCCACAAGCVAADAHDSEIEISTSETSRANRFLTNSTPRQLMADIFKSADKTENDITNDASISYNV